MKKQEMTSISDYIIVFISKLQEHEEYKDWRLRERPKQGVFCKDLVTAKYSLTFHSYVFRCQKKTQSFFFSTTFSIMP